METTKKGNLKIKVNPERKYKGQFVGYKYFDIDTVKRAFPFIDDFAQLDPEGFDLGDGANNKAMIIHHVEPIRRVGHIVE